jgi:hypothetical protein
VWVTEEDCQSRVDTQLGVLSHLGTLVPGQGPPELIWQCRDAGSDGIAHTLRAVPGQGRSVLGPRLAVFFHARQVQEHGEAGWALNKYADGRTVQGEDTVGEGSSGLD